ncbi:hypothetical protein Gotur_002112 [Gossypium turneri]
MEIEEFPSHITEKIKNIWETWNSPPRLSSDSLHLDEIEEMNLNNMDDARWKKPLMLIKHIHVKTNKSCNLEDVIKPMMM